MTKGREKIEKVMRSLSLLFTENPCCWNDLTLLKLADGLEVMLGEKLHGGLSMYQVAEYYNVTLRTIERWRGRYSDFPEPVDPYAKTLSFPTDKVIEWKLIHRDKF